MRLCVASVPGLALWTIATVSACGARTGLRLATDASVAAARDSGVPTCAAADLCGGGRCAVLLDEPIAPAAGSNDAPSIVLDESGMPAVLLEVATADYRGIVARRSSSGWSTTDLPVPVATGSLALGASGPLVIAAYDGAFHTALLTESGSTFVVTGTVPTDEVVSSTNLGRTADGALHIVSTGGTGRGTAVSLPQYHRYDGTFHRTDLGAASERSGGGQLALGAHHGAYAAWRDLYDPSSLEGSRVQWWRANTGAVEQVTIGAGDESGPLAVVVRDIRGGDVPSIAVSGMLSTVLWVLTRNPAGGWSRAVVFGGGAMPCGRPATCSVELRSVSLIADAAVHVLYGVNLVLPDGTRAARLALNVVGAPPESFEELLNHANATLLGARAVRDSCGQIHVAYIENDLASATTLARYALVGAR